LTIFPLDLASHIATLLTFLPQKYCTNLGTLFIIPY
jgi:hypothetical protein